MRSLLINLMRFPASFSRDVGVIVVTALLLGTTLSQAQVVKKFGEVVSNGVTTGEQQRPSVAACETNYVVAWQTQDEDGDGWGIKAEVYDSAGAVTKSEFIVNTTTTDDQIKPDVAMASDGDFVVTYASQGLDGDDWGVYLRSYSVTGSAYLTEVKLNSTTIGAQKAPSISMKEDGGFVVVWMSEDEDGAEMGVYGRQFTFNTSVSGTSFGPINTTTAGYQGHPDVFMKQDGSFVVVWQGDNADSSVYGVFMQRYNSSAVAVGSEVMVNTTLTGTHTDPSVAVDENGNIIVVWTRKPASGVNSDIVYQRFNSNGVAIGTETVLNSSSAPNNKPSVDVSLDSVFVATWQSYGVDGSYDGVYMASLFASSGNELESQRPVNIQTDDFQQFAVIGADHGGEQVYIAFQDGMTRSVTTSDGDGYGVYHSKFAVRDTTPPVASCSNQSVSLNALGHVVLDAEVIGAGSSDNFGIEFWTLSEDTMFCEDVSANVVTLTVTDFAGLSDQCNALITVSDNINPVATCKDVTINLDESGDTVISISDVLVSATDNCSLTDTSLNSSSFRCSDVGANTVTVTVTDASGNVGQCTSEVTIADVLNPTVVCQDVSVYLDGLGQASIEASDLDGGSYDNCSISTYAVLEDVDFVCADTGINALTLMVTDVNGNSATCGSNVTVFDTVSPTMQCKNINLYLDESLTASITVDSIDDGSFDNCSSSLTLAASQYDFTTADRGANSVILTGGDVSGNQSTCAAVVTVIDTITPAQTSQLQSQYCLANLNPNNGEVYVELVAGANNYRVVFFDGLGVSDTIIAGKFGRVRLTDVPNIYFNGTFSVSVEPVLTAQDTEFGVSCNITTNTTTTVASAYCDLVTSSYNTTLYPVLVPTGTKYRYKFVGQTSSNEYTADVGKYGRLRLYEVPGLLQGETYDVSVTPMINGTFGSYGTACDLTFDLPTTQVSAAYCGQTYLNKNQNLIYSDLVAGADRYEFKLVRLNDGFEMEQMTGKYGRLRFQDVAAMTFDSDYEVSVRARVNGLFSNYGSTCTITCSAPTRFGSSALAELVEMYPNPFENTIAVASELSDVRLRVFDMVGHQHEEIALHGSTVVEIGSELRAGSYQVEIWSGDELIDVRQLVKLK